MTTPTTRILVGDVLARLRDMHDESVHCVVTSPPYWGLRDYGAEGQLGLEPTPEEHVARMVEVFREVRRVLRADGTLWLNYGDSYAAGHGGSTTEGNYIPNVTRHGPGSGPRDREDVDCASWSTRDHSRKKITAGLKPKDLVGMPWRIAFALQADGWYLRSDIIWAKPNPMPESVTDRPTKAHEYLFLLSKAPRYFYDADAVAEKAMQPVGVPSLVAQHKQAAIGANQTGTLGTNQGKETRNLRTVWAIPTHPFPEAHFATFPPALVEPCIKAGTSERGCCASCGAPWVRIIEKGEPDTEHQKKCGADAQGGYNGTATKDYALARAQDPSAVKARILEGMRKRETVDWQPACECGCEPVPCTVLDPFLGSGTTAIVANGLGRHCVGIELNPDYARMAEQRIKRTRGMFAKVTLDTAEVPA